jgi:hypothetical protein
VSRQKRFDFIDQRQVIRAGPGEKLLPLFGPQIESLMKKRQ